MNTDDTFDPPAIEDAAAVKRKYRELADDVVDGSDLLPDEPRYLLGKVIAACVEYGHDFPNAAKRLGLEIVALSQNSPDRVRPMSNLDLYRQRDDALERLEGLRELAEDFRAQSEQHRKERDRWRRRSKAAEVDASKRRDAMIAIAELVPSRFQYGTENDEVGLVDWIERLVHAYKTWRERAQAATWGDASAPAPHPIDDEPSLGEVHSPVHSPPAEYIKRDLLMAGARQEVREQYTLNQMRARFGIDAKTTAGALATILYSPEWRLQRVSESGEAVDCAKRIDVTYDRFKIDGDEQE